MPDLSSLSDALVGVEWVLHAASQDLPGLAEQGLKPSRVFDTELGARLLGLDRVGLAAVVADALGLGLAKEHSAVDWSTRPLPSEWLRYAALDVEVLVELREVLAERLAVAGKAEWAAQEFEAVRTAPLPPPRVEPWRRVSGLHAIRDARRLAVVRELWLTRDQNARTRDISPGRVLPDHAIVAAAQALPRSVPELTALPAFAGKGTRRRAALWQQAVDRGLATPDADLPSVRGPKSDAPPPPRAWAEKDPAAAARLVAAREVVTDLSTHPRGPGGEPAAARPAAPAVLDAACGARRRGDLRVPAGRRRPTVADRAGRAAPRGRVRGPPARLTPVLLWSNLWLALPGRPG